MKEPDGARGVHDRVDVGECVIERVVLEETAQSLVAPRKTHGRKEERTHNSDVRDNHELQTVRVCKLGEEV